MKNKVILRSVLVFFFLCLPVAISHAAGNEKMNIQAREDVKQNLLAAKPSADNKKMNIPAKEAYKRIKKNPDAFYILDVRMPSEFKESHLQNAHNLDFWGPTFENDMAKLPKDKTIVIYCRSGIRSGGAVEMLQKEGFDKLIHIEDGIDGWKKAGLPLEKKDNK